MEYYLAKQYSADLLVKEVNEKVDKGWIVCGNPFAGQDGALFWPMCLPDYAPADACSKCVNRRPFS